MDDRQRLVEEVLGHRFRDAELLLQACTHASACDTQAADAERLAAANERLEFLGDALLGAAVVEQLYRRHPQADEGSLSRSKSRLVSRRILARAMEASPLLDHCLVGPQLQAPWPDSVKANLAEGLLGAIYLDGGWSALTTAVDRLLGRWLAEQAPEPRADWKNQLQELSLEQHGRLPDYHTERSGGSDHAPAFTSRVRVGEEEATATAGSRRKAETAAARALLDRLRRQAPHGAGD